MRNLFLTLCALVATVAFSTNVRAGGVVSVDNSPAGQQLVVDFGTVDTPAWMRGADIPNVNGTSQTTTAADSLGNVYVIGGGTGPGPDVTLNTNQKYTPSKDSWERAANVPTPLRAFGSVAVLGDTFYIFGGFNGTAAINTLNIYDAAGDAWSTGANIPPSGGGFGSAVCVVNKRIFIAGGSNGQTSAFEYDPVGDSYTSIAPMIPGALRIHGVGVDELNECHAFGNGFDGNTHNIYNVDTNQWRPGPPIPFGVTDPAVVAVGTQIHVIGGILGPARDQIFDAVEGTWSQNPTLPGPTNNTSGTLVVTPAAGPLPVINTVYVEGGFDGANSIPTNYIGDYTP